MKNKTNKLRKLERERKSILTDDLEHCFICKNQPIDIHEIYGGANRKISMIKNFCVPLCRTCHTKATLNNDFSLILKKLCQTEFEKTATREEFMRLIGKNYLG